MAWPKASDRIRAGPDLGNWRICPGDLWEFLGPLGMQVITRFNLGTSRSSIKGTSTLEQSILFAGGTLHPIRRHFAQHSRGHEIDRLAVTLLELAADHGLVTQERNGMTLRVRIDVHAVFGKQGIQTALGRRPEKSAGSEQDERTGQATALGRDGESAGPA
jgi:hypothetical protein